MIGALISILVALVIIGVLWWGLQRILAVIPIAEPFRTLIYVVMVIIMVLICIWVLLQLLGVAGINVRMPF